MTKEEILNEELSEDILEIIEQKDKPEELRYFKRYILDAMERYAQQQVKNLNISDVSNNEVSVCLPHCPNKETNADNCKWRGHTCFLCDMQT